MFGVGSKTIIQREKIRQREREGTERTEGERTEKDRARERERENRERTEKDRV